MNKAIIVSIALFLLLPVASYAASIGGAKTSGQGNFRTTVDIELGFDRDLDIDSATQKDFQDGNLIQKNDWEDGFKFEDAEFSKMNRVMAKLSYGIIDTLDVYARVGIASYEGEMDLSSLEEPNGYGSTEEFTFGDEGTSPVWGLGLKSAYDFGDNWLVGADLQYLRQRGENTQIIKQKRTDDSYRNYYYTIETKVEEWHIAPYAGKKIGDFVAYAGVKYSDFNIKSEWSTREKSSDSTFKNTRTVKLEADDNIGVFLGLDYELANRFSFNIEGRFIDETAMSLGATYHF